MGLLDTQIIYLQYDASKHYFWVNAHGIFLYSVGPNINKHTYTQTLGLTWNHNRRYDVTVKTSFQREL